MATAKAQTAKVEKQMDQASKTVEQISVASAENLRESMDRTLTAFSEMGAFSKENFEAMVASAAACSKGIEAMSARAAAFSKQAMENHMTATKAMMSARSVQELVERQAEYARASFDGYIAELNQFSDMLAGVTKDAMQPFNELVSAMGQIVQNGMQSVRVR